MFEGFNESTIRYYQAIGRNNCKNTHQENEMLYLEGVKYPLEELYYELYGYFSKVDSDLLSNKRRCISSAYNDARFCSDAPIKEYFYIRFRLDTVNKKNALGFFFDASLTGYKFGLNIYNLDTRGMEKIRDYILDNKHYAKEVIEKFNKAGLLEVRGEKYRLHCHESAVRRPDQQFRRSLCVHGSVFGCAAHLGNTEGERTGRIHFISG